MFRASSLAFSTKSSAKRCASASCSGVKLTFDMDTSTLEARVNSAASGQLPPAYEKSTYFSAAYPFAKPQAVSPCDSLGAESNSTIIMKQEMVMVKCTRRLLLFLLAMVSVSCCVPSAHAQGKTATKPNFLFIYTDDQRWDALSVVQKEQGDKARFPWLKTPNLDRLAAQGVRFRNAFVVNSLCSPSRASFLTGKYGHVNGIVNNHTPFRVDNVTWATLLRLAGYVTGYIGKWHMGPQSGQRPGFDFSA